MSIHNLFSTESFPWQIIAAALAILIILIFIFRATRPLPKRLERKIRRRKYLSAEQFLTSWQESKRDFPGCYCILIYDKKLILNPMHWDDIYVGQSVNVRRRVFSHLKGHGNGDVYYGRKSGCKVYLLIARCRPKKLNQTERDLISYFNATSSLNMTRGGSLRR